MWLVGFFEAEEGVVGVDALWELVVSEDVGDGPGAWVWGAVGGGEGEGVASLVVAVIEADFMGFDSSVECLPVEGLDFELVVGHVGAFCVGWWPVDNFFHSCG